MVLESGTVASGDPLSRNSTDPVGAADGTAPWTVAVNVTASPGWAVLAEAVRVVADAVGATSAVALSVTSLPPKSCTRTPTGKDPALPKVWLPLTANLPPPRAVKV